MIYDLIIVGGGIVGLVNALLLVKNTDLRIAIIDARALEPRWSAFHYDSRVYAITPASRKVLESIHVWPEIEAKRLSAFLGMQVWESSGGGSLAFDHVQFNVPSLGYIVEENLIQAVLLEKIRHGSQVDLLCPVNLKDLLEQESHIELQYLDQGSHGSLSTRLLVGADGASSWVREEAGMAIDMRSYQHSALIAQVQTELSHGQIARQIFITHAHATKGILAFLPLESQDQCSIVWSTAPEEAELLFKLDDQAFQEKLGQAFEFRLGKIKAVSKRYLFPLYESHVESYVKNRLALIGDAAHTIHPLAGQGVNLGIADAAYLAEVITVAATQGRDFASRYTLRRYERARKAQNRVMMSAVKLLKDLFSSDHRYLSLLRHQGLNLTNRLSWVKRFLAQYAME